MNYFNPKEAKFPMGTMLMAFKMTDYYL